MATHNKEKLYNAITYLVTDAWTPKTKLYKLLYYIDFEHYRETGRSITGLEYQAWEMGPVPVQLHEYIDIGEPELLERFEVEERRLKIGKSIHLTPKKPFDDSHFTKRELRILQDVKERFDLYNASDMIGQTHLPGQAWHRVWEVEKRHFSPIPYEYVLDEDEKEEILTLARERQEILENYQ